eukprot:TRINITY_DN17950_c0_g1_i1.p1 TRINITY_DN17950_c0_g1~~TRINITY_DN17950_c0_g1_i1.p1  ORF type:complete len:783 (-),score=140.13 TRINITY_DN17950_c0_g1_i1:88-2436(-)
MYGPLPVQDPSAPPPPPLPSRQRVLEQTQRQNLQKLEQLEQLQQKLQQQQQLLVQVAAAARATSPQPAPPSRATASAMATREMLPLPPLRTSQGEAIDWSSGTTGAPAQFAVAPAAAENFTAPLSTGNFTAPLATGSFSAPGLATPSDPRFGRSMAVEEPPPPPAMYDNQSSATFFGTGEPPLLDPGMNGAWMPADDAYDQSGNGDWRDNREKIATIVVAAVSAVAAVVALAKACGTLGAPGFDVLSFAAGGFLTFRALLVIILLLCILGLVAACAMGFFAYAEDRRPLRMAMSASLALGVLLLIFAVPTQIAANRWRPSATRATNTICQERSYLSSVFGCPSGGDGTIGDGDLADAPGAKYLGSLSSGAARCGAMQALCAAPPAGFNAASACVCRDGSAGASTTQAAAVTTSSAPALGPTYEVSGTASLTASNVQQVLSQPDSVEAAVQKALAAKAGVSPDAVSVSLSATPPTAAAAPATTQGLIAAAPARRLQTVAGFPGSPALPAGAGPVYAYYHVAVPDSNTAASAVAALAVANVTTLSSEVMQGLVASSLPYSVQVGSVTAQAVILPPPTFTTTTTTGTTTTATTATTGTATTATTAVSVTYTTTTSSTTTVTIPCSGAGTQGGCPASYICAAECSDQPKCLTWVEFCRPMMTEDRYPDDRRLFSLPAVAASTSHRGAYCRTWDPEDTAEWCYAEQLAACGETSSGTLASAEGMQSAGPCGDAVESRSDRLNADLDGFGTALGWSICLAALLLALAFCARWMLRAGSYDRGGRFVYE